MRSTLKTVLMFLGFSVTALIPLLSHAQATEEKAAESAALSAALANESLKIGYFNFSQVLANIPQAQEAEKRLGDEFADRKANIEGLDKELKALAEELQRDALVLSSAEQDAKRRELRNRQREFQLLLEEYQEDLSLRQNQETAALQKLVRQAVLDIAKEGQFDLIIDQAAVLYASEKVNITAQVLQRLQQQN